MSFSSKFLTALALAVALSPFAAHARSDRGETPKAEYYLAPIAGEPAAQAAKNMRVSEVSQGQNVFSGATVVTTGVHANSFRDSVGG